MPQIVVAVMEAEHLELVVMAGFLFYKLTAKHAVYAHSFILISPVGMVFGVVFFLGIENNERGGF